VVVHLIQVIGEAVLAYRTNLCMSTRRIRGIRLWRFVTGLDLDLLWDVANVDVPCLADQVSTIHSQLAVDSDG
jgi:uncharacterized protein with HEPN domain